MRGKSSETRKSLFDINGRQYQCYFKGSADFDRIGDIVFLNGLFYGASSWAYQTRIPGLLKNYRLIMLDYPCQGKSSSVKDKICAEDIVDDLIGLLVQIEVKSVLLIGHSLGGFLAGMLAGRVSKSVEGALLNKEVRGLLVVNSSLYTPFMADKFFREIKRRMEEVGCSNESGINLHKKIKDIFRGFLPFAMGDSYLEYIEDYKEVLLDDYAQYNFDPMAVACLIDGMLKSNGDVELFKSVLSGVKCPVRIVSGGCDKIFPPVMGYQLSVAYPDAQLLELANAGHAAMVEKHHEFNDYLIRFLSSIYPENNINIESKSLIAHGDNN